MAAILSLSFNDGAVPGVEGQAALFDGFDARIVVPAAEVKAPEGSFTVDVWVCPSSVPKSPCPVVCRQGEGPGDGWSLWLDCFGKVHFRAGEAEVVSESGLPLREWSRLTALFESGRSIRLAVDGKEVADRGLSMTSVEQAGYDVWIGRTAIRTPSFMENKSIPIYSSFDGGMDELNIHADGNVYKKILKKKFVRPTAPGTDVPGFEERHLPSGPDGLAFGSWYMPLKFYKAFDDRWRGSLPDVVVSLGEEQPWKLVFWHGISYAPCFVTEKGNWMCNEFVERAKVTGWGCPENMSDKHADFSSVRIVENTPARTVVVWRNLPVGVNQKIPYQSEESQWGDCSEETYIIYPDGACVRKMDLWTSCPERCRCCILRRSLKTCWTPRASCQWPQWTVRARSMAGTSVARPDRTPLRWTGPTSRLPTSGASGILSSSLKTGTVSTKPAAADRESTVIQAAGRSIPTSRGATTGP